MRSRHLLLLTILLFAACSQLFAQESTLRIGIGAEFSPSEAFPAALSPSSAEGTTPIMISIPLVIPNARLLLDPRIGFYSTTEETKNTVLTTTTTFTTTTSLLNTDLGLFLLMPLGAASNAYVGLRIGYARWSVENKVSGGGDTTTTRGGLYLGPGVGGEYFLSEYFAIGGEVALLYYKFGDFSISPSVTGTTRSEISTSILKTDAFLYARFFFNR